MDDKRQQRAPIILTLKESEPRAKFVSPIHPSTFILRGKNTPITYDGPNLKPYGQRTGNLKKCIQDPIFFHLEHTMIQSKSFFFQYLYRYKQKVLFFIQFAILNSASLQKMNEFD